MIKDLERDVCLLHAPVMKFQNATTKNLVILNTWSEKTGLGQPREGWRDKHQPIVCSYKLLTVKLEVWGLQTGVEQFVHKISCWLDTDRPLRGLMSGTVSPMAQNNSENSFVTPRLGFQSTQLHV